MTIQDLGSIGELVAAIATVATLLYLALQICNNSEVFRTSNYWQLSSQFAEFTQQLSQDLRFRGSEIRDCPDPQRVRHRNELRPDRRRRLGRHGDRRAHAVRSGVPRAGPGRPGGDPDGAPGARRDGHRACSRLLVSNNSYYICECEAVATSSPG